MALSLLSQIHEVQIFLLNPFPCPKHNLKQNSSSLYKRGLVNSEGSLTSDNSLNPIEQEIIAYEYKGYLNLFFGRSFAYILLYFELKYTMFTKKHKM